MWYKYLFMKNRERGRRKNSLEVCNLMYLYNLSKFWYFIGDNNFMSSNGNFLHRNVNKSLPIIWNTQKKWSTWHYFVMITVVTLLFSLIYNEQYWLRNLCTTLHKFTEVLLQNRYHFIVECYVLVFLLNNNDRY